MNWRLRDVASIRETRGVTLSACLKALTTGAQWQANGNIALHGRADLVSQRRPRIRVSCR